MTDQNIDNSYIDSLYNLINVNNSSETFYNNLEVWKTFYNNRNIIIKKNILDDKLFTIIKFLLKQEKGEIAPNFHSEIIKILHEAQIKVTTDIKNSSPNTEENIGILFKNLQHHDILCEDLKLNNQFKEAKQYTSKLLELYTINSLISVTYNQFFNLDPNVGKRLIEIITKNTILLQKDNIKEHIVNNDLLLQYQNKILTMKQFIGETLDEDELIHEIKIHQIKESKIVLKLLNNLSIESILEMFDYNLNNLLIFLTEVDYLSNTKKQALIENIFDKTLENNCGYCLDLIINNNQNQLFRNYLTKEKYNQIITNSLNSVPLDFTSDMIKFLLKCENNKDKPKFINQCRYLITKEEGLKSKENFDVEGIKKILKEQEFFSQSFANLINEPLIINKNDPIKTKEIKAKKSTIKGTIIDFNTSIELLKAYFENKINLNELSMQAIIRSIATTTVDCLKIPNNGIYFFKNNDIDGNFEASTQTINLNTSLIDNFLNNKKSTYERLKIFEALFHEIKHAKIDKEKQANNIDINIYEIIKENLLIYYDNDYYKNNYRKVKEEIEARITGIDFLSKFIEAYLPAHLNAIQDKIIQNLEQEEKLLKEQDATRIMQFLNQSTKSFHHGFDTLLKYNPNILREYPIFNLEYYSNGTVKSYEDIWLNRNNQNQELIDEILKIRYPEEDNLKIDSSHIK